MYLLIAIPVSAKDEKVPVYMFSKDGCPACISASEYFEELSEEYPDLFEVIEIVVFGPQWEQIDDGRTELLVKVYDKFGEDSSAASTPTIVIGDYHTLGLPQDTDLVYDAIMKVKNSKKPVDEVKKIVEELELDLEELQKYEKVQTEEVKDESEGGKYDAIIAVGIIVVLIGGFAGLIVIGKK